MMNLIQTVKFLTLNDDELVSLCTEHHSLSAPTMSIREMRNKLDMKSIKVKHVGFHHYKFTTDVTIEFIVEEKDYIDILKMIRR